MKRNMMMAAIGTSVLLVFSCQNPASLAKVAEPVAAGSQISIALTGLSPVFEELFSPAPASDARSVSSRAFIGATRAQFKLVDITDAALEITVDTWSVSISDMNSGSSYGNIRTASHSVPSTINLAGTPFRLEAEIFNDTVSTTEPVVTGFKTGITITPDQNNSVSITCVPTGAVELASGTPVPVETAPFVLVDSMVTAVGGEAWYKIEVTRKRLTLNCTVDALNTSTVAGVLYKEDGSVASGPVEFSATSSQPFSKIFTLSTSDPVTPVTYYLGVAQSRQLGAGSNHGFTISATDGPADPPVPSLTPGQGTITASWQSDVSVGSYTLYYGVRGYADQYGTILKIIDIPATGELISKTVALSAVEGEYGFWLEWKKDGIVATSPGIEWTSYGYQARGTTATATALHTTTIVNTDWTCEAIGKIPDGSATHDTGVYTVTGAGVQGLSGADPRPTWLQFLHQPVAGDFTITLRVTAVGGNGTTGLASEAGIAVRSDLSPESDELLFGPQSGQKNVVLTYPQTGEGSNSPWSTADALPVWLTVQRVGDHVTASYSIDNKVTWIEVKPRRFDDVTQSIVYDDMQFTGTVEIGMYVIGNNWATQVAAVFDSVSITTP